MRFAILTNDYESFTRPLGYGLQRMLGRIGVESEVFVQGEEALKNLSVSVVAELMQFDAIIHVTNVPLCFARRFCPGIEFLHEMTSLPIISYQHYFIGNMGHWMQRMRDGVPEYGIEPDQFGLERYDWYLAVGMGNVYPLAEADWPLSVIGCDVNDGTMLPSVKPEFRVLFDFAREGWEADRQMQLEVVERLDIPYSKLSGGFAYEEIKRIYDRHAVLMLSFPESFGRPILEIQACGGLVAAPQAWWAMVHFIRPDVARPGVGDLSENFLIYDSDPDKLAVQLQHARDTFDPYRNFGTFVANNGTFFCGELAELRRFVRKVEDGTIHGGLHREHEALNHKIVTELPFDPTKIRKGDPLPVSA